MRLTEGVLSGQGWGSETLRALALVVVIALSACSDPTGVAPIVVEGLERIEPEPSWRTIYEEVETCTGVEGDFSRVTWFSASSIRDTLEREPGDPAGNWLGPWGRPHDIAIHEVRLSRGGERLAGTVRHESIHELLQEASHDGEVWCECDGRDHLFVQC